MSHQISKDSIDNLNEEFNTLKIENHEPNKLYKILSNTKWKIHTPQNEERKKSCCEKYCLSKLGGIDNIICDLKDVMYNVLASDYIKGNVLNLERLLVSSFL